MPSVADDSGNLAERSTRKVTVVFPLFHSEEQVCGLLEALEQQSSEAESERRQSEWLEAIFIDNASQDRTVEILRGELKKRGNPKHYRVVVNSDNLGLSGSLNRALSMVETPFVVTCHTDCRFGSRHYVSKMVSFLESHPRAGAVTGLPAIEPNRGLPFTERVNLVANLMDIFEPEDSVPESTLRPVGFAEGRCDGFRMDALRSVGFYDTTLKFAGEDQVLCGALRKLGYQVLQAPHLKYFLSVSAQQDSLWKLASHQMMFGRAHPYLLLRSSGAAQGALGENAGVNRSMRSILRLSQVFSAFTYALCIVLIFLKLPFIFWGFPLLFVLALKAALFQKHFKSVPFSYLEFAAFFLLQPFFDLAYAMGLFQGLWHLRAGSREIG